MVGSVNVNRFHNPKLMQKADVDFVEHDPSQDTATQKWVKDQGGWWHYVT